MQVDEENKRMVAKIELSLEIKDIQYSELQSDHERLDFEHKELTIHAEKLQQQIKLLSSKKLNRPRCYDTTKLQSPCEGTMYIRHLNKKRKLKVKEW